MSITTPDNSNSNNYTKFPDVTPAETSFRLSRASTESGDLLLPVSNESCNNLEKENSLSLNPPHRIIIMPELTKAERPPKLEKPKSPSQEAMTPAWEDETLSANTSGEYPVQSPPQFSPKSLRTQHDEVVQRVKDLLTKFDRIYQADDKQLKNPCLNLLIVLRTLSSKINQLEGIRKLLYPQEVTPHPKMAYLWREYNQKKEDFAKINTTNLSR